MPNVLPRDILLRVGGQTLARHNVLAWAGSNRADEFKEIVTRAGSSLAINRDRYLVGVGPNAPRIEYPPGLVDQFGNPLCGIRHDNAVTNKLTTPEGPYNGGNWTLAGATVPSTNNPSPRLGANGTPDLTANFVREDTSTGVHGLFQSYTIGAASKRGLYVFLKAVGSRTKGRVRITNPSGVETSIVFDLAAGTVSSAAEWGGIIALADSWYAIPCFGGAGAGNTSCQFGVVFRDAGNNESYTGDGASGMYIWGCVATDNQMVLHYWGTAASSTLDSVVVPANFGPVPELTILTRLARPMWADAGASDILLNPGLWQISTVEPQIRGYSVQAQRILSGDIQTVATDSFAQNQNIPAGASLTHLIQTKNLLTGGQIAIDVGAGLSAFGTAATPFSSYGSKFGNQNVDVAHVQTTGSLCGVLLDLIIARGLFSLNEMLAVP